MEQLDFDEDRMDIIGQNGNEGGHYYMEDANKALRILDEAIDRIKWFEQTLYVINGGIPTYLTKERENLKWLLEQVEREIEEHG